MRISWFIAIEAFLLSIVFAKTEDPNRLEDLTTQESISIANVNSSVEENFQQSKEKEKPRNVRHTENIISPIFTDNHWSSIENPIFFEPTQQDKEKTKLVLIEPFFRAKKMEKGFWGWLKKIFGNNNDKNDKIGQGPLIGPVKVPGMSDNVYIRAADTENEANHVVIHLMMKKPLEKEIKFENHLPLVQFDTVHQLPVENSNFQSEIISPHFSHEGLFDKSAHYPVDNSWSSIIPSSSIHIPTVKENFYANPSFFRKHSTDNEGTEFSSTLTKDIEEPQQFTAWSQQYDPPVESYNQEDPGQLLFYRSEENRQFSSAREDINNLQRSQTSELEISENKESLPLYPPLFNSSFGQNISNNRNNQIYVTNGNNLKSSSGPKRESQPYPGLGAYKTELKIVNLPLNISHANIEEEYISNVGIQEVEAPNLSQAENRGIYQFSEIDNIEESKGNKKIENSKKIRNSQNYDSIDSNKNFNSNDSISNVTEIDESLKTISASYPWDYRSTNNKFNISIAEDDKIKVSDSQSVSKSESEEKKNVRNESRLRTNRIRTRNREIKNKNLNPIVEEKNSQQENKSKDITENKKIEELKVTEETEEKDNKMEKPLTAEKVKEFFLKESKRFEQVLKTVEEESEAIKEETAKVNSQNNEDLSSKDTKEELKINPEEKLKINTKEIKDNEENSKNQETKIKNQTEESEKLTIKKELKPTIEIPSKIEKITIEDNSKAIKDALEAVKEDLKAVKEELKVSREKSKLQKEIKSEETPKSEDSKFINENAKKERIIKPVRKLTKSQIEEKLKTKEIISDEKLKSFEDDIPLKMLFNTRENSQEKLTTEIKNSEENEKLQPKISIVSDSRIINKSRSRKPLNKEIKKSNSTRFELKKPKISILDGRFRSKLKNTTSNNLKSNSTVKNEATTIITTPPSHITRIYGKNRSVDKLKYNAIKEKIVKSEENKKIDQASMEKPKVVRLNKFSPRTRNFKPKFDKKIVNGSEEIKSD